MLKYCVLAIATVCLSFGHEIWRHPNDRIITKEVYKLYKSINLYSNEVISWIKLMQSSNYAKKHVCGTVLITIHNVSYLLYYHFTSGTYDLVITLTNK